MDLVPRRIIVPILGLALGAALSALLSWVLQLDTIARFAEHTFGMWVVVAGVLGVALAAGGVWLGTEIDRLHRDSITDPLTGTYNRRYLMARLPDEVARALRHQTPLSMLLIDLDQFKAINDAEGHDTGDLVLESVGQSLRRNQRASDVSARVGGDEFVVMLPHTTSSEARVFADRIRALIASMPKHARTTPTVSIGIAELWESGAKDAHGLMAAADLALYAAKAAGRDRAMAVPGALLVTAS